MRLLILLTLSVAMLECHAQLADPTVPPLVVRQAEMAQAEGKEGEEVVADTARLTSILISPRRRVAVIDGKTVRLGEKVSGATLVTLTSNSAVLMKGSVKEVLQLYPLSANQAPREKQPPRQD